MATRRRELFKVLATALLTATFGCDEAGDARTVHVGRAGDDILVAVVIEGDAVLAYACDGTAAGVAVNAWFRGAVSGDAFTLTHATQPITLTGTFAGDVLDATLDLDGAALGFTGAPATGDAGLYEGDDGDLRGGWIFTADGDQRGAVLRRTTGDVAAATLTSPDQTTFTFAGTTLQIAPARP